MSFPLAHLIIVAKIQRHIWFYQNACQWNRNYRRHRREHVFKSDNNIGTEVLRTDWRKALLSAHVQGQFIDSMTKTCEYAHW